MKKTLAHTNPYLRDPLVRKRMIEHAAYHSSVVEGAEKLERLKVSGGTVRSTAFSSRSLKKAAKRSKSQA